MKVVIIGSVLYGNQGAASMLKASLQLLTESDPKTTFTLFSVYPEEDKKLNDFKHLSILPARPIYLALVINSLSFLYWLLPPMRSLLRRQRHIRALSEADVYLDQGGITFVDGRAIFLLYNVASILPGILVTKRVVKCSQALGPFTTKINYYTAKLILPKIKVIIARGEVTYSYLKKLHLKNVVQAPDLAFAMKITPRKKAKAKQVLKKLGIKKDQTIVVAPSQVMQKKCEKAGVNYADLVAELVNKISQTGQHVTLLPHSTRSTNSTHNNDLPLLNNIYEKIINKQGVSYIKQSLGPEELRYIIGQSKLVITSRFHAMVSALSMEVPVMVIGWNHKYQEVLEMFKLNKDVLTVKNMTKESVWEAYTASISSINTDKALIAKQLPDIKEKAATHQQIIIEAAKR